MEIKKDCFAYKSENPGRKINPKEHCDALIKLFCACENCRFYKSKEEK